MMRRPVPPGGKPPTSSSDTPRRAFHLLVALNLAALLAFWGATRTLASSAVAGTGGGGAVVLAGGRRASAGAGKNAFTATQPAVTALDVDATLTTAGMKMEGAPVSPLPSRPQWKGALDTDALVAARAAELKAAGVGGAPGAARGRRGYYLSYVETDPLYPFQRIRFADGSDTGVVAVIAPFYDLNYFRSTTQRALFWRLKAAGHIVLGVSSYQEFPGPISNPHDDRHVTPGDRTLLANVDGWLHCFRPAVAAAVLPPGVPRVLLSESDFTDAERRDGGGSLIPWGPPTVVKKYDLAYSDQGGPWNDYARNWTLAVACIAKLAEARNVTTLVLGRDPSEAPELKPWVEKGLVVKAAAKLPWRDFLKEVEAVSCEGGWGGNGREGTPPPHTLPPPPSHSHPVPHHVRPQHARRLPSRRRRGVVVGCGRSDQRQHRWRVEVRPTLHRDLVHVPQRRRHRLRLGQGAPGGGRAGAEAVV